MARTDSAPIMSAPTLLAITAEGDYRGVIDAGRLLIRAWIYLNEHGLAVHPYYVITDQIERLRAGTLPKDLCPAVQSIARETAELCGIRDGRSLYMILRVGFPEKNPPRSKRVPLSEVYSDESNTRP